METVLVTGGCGLIGQHICSGLLKKGFEVIAVDREEGILAIRVSFTIPSFRLHRPIRIQLPKFLRIIR